MPISSESLEALVRFALEEHIRLVIVGPEAPLAGGLVDHCQAAGVKVFGPSQAAARLESSKTFAKSFMFDQGVPAADSQTFRELEPTLAHLRRNPGPVAAQTIIHFREGESLDDFELRMHAAEHKLIVRATQKALAEMSDNSEL